MAPFSNELLNAVCNAVYTLWLSGNSADAQLQLRFLQEHQSDWNESVSRFQQIVSRYQNHGFTNFISQCIGAGGIGGYYFMRR